MQQLSSHLVIKGIYQIAAMKPDVLLTLSDVIKHTTTATANMCVVISQIHLTDMLILQTMWWLSIKSHMYNKTPVCKLW